jgi:hypothetical protein
VVLDLADWKVEAMNRENIIRMAREAGAFPELSETPEKDIVFLRRFAALVAAAEREACHALRQTLPNPHEHCQVSAHAYDMALVAYGAAIRARGQE